MGSKVDPKPNLGFLYRHFNVPSDVFIDGIAYKDGYVYFALQNKNKTWLITRLPSRCTQEEFDLLKSKIIMTKEAREILCYLAVAYRLRQQIMFVGPTAIGKTFLIKVFSKLIEGPDFDIFDFYCNAQTDASELMGKYVPNPDKGTTMENGKVDEREFVFQWGVVPKAMTYTKGKEGLDVFPRESGFGTMLHIEEVGLAQPEIINALLKMRGEGGQITDHIQLWEDGGCRIHTGSNFWVVFSTNPPEGGYLGRNDIDPALARGMIFVKMPDLGSDSMVLAADRIFSQEFNALRKNKVAKSCGGSRAGQPFAQIGGWDDDFGMVYDIWKNKEILQGITQILAGFHESLKGTISNGSSGSSQKVPLTYDDMSRVAAFCSCHQVSDQATGRVDVCATLDNAIDLYYLARLRSCDENKEDEKIFDNATRLKNDCVYGRSDTARHITGPDGQKVKPPDYFLAALEKIEKNTDFGKELEQKEVEALMEKYKVNWRELAQGCANEEHFLEEVKTRCAKIPETMVDVSRQIAEEVRREVFGKKK